MAKQSRTNTTADITGTSELVPLSKATGWHVREGDPHVEGWDVVASGNTQVGQVDDLLIDLQAQKARYLIVKVDDAVTGTKGARVAVPLGTARLDENDDTVLLPNMSPQQVASLPSYQAGRFTREHENTLRQRLGGGTAQVASGDYYDNALFDENHFYGNRRQGEFTEQRIPLSEEEIAVGKRRAQAGEVDIRKTVETEHVQQRVPVAREEVEIERRPVSADRGAQAAEIGEQEIHVPLMEEEAVVEKRPVVKEELVVKKRVVEDTQQVEADVKRERVDIDKHGDVTAHVEGDESSRRADRGRRAP